LVQNQAAVQGGRISNSTTSPSPIRQVTEIKEKYISEIKKICPNLILEELSYLENGMTVVSLSNKFFYVHSGEIQKNIGFIFSGLLRAFYIDKDGNEITVRFTRENGYATDYTAFISQLPSKYYIQCLEPTTIVNLSYEHIQEGYKNFAGLERLGRLIAEEVLKSQQKRIESFLFENAEQRYLNFIKESPELFNRVSLSYLSTFLGIERPSLSRIRKKLTNK
jgi:CRP/FNR family transcriptional regulator, anaerobic regulatory protein